MGNAFDILPQPGDSTNTLLRRAVRALSELVDLGGAVGSSVLSVAGRTGAVTLTSSDLTDTTAAGRALLDDADADAQRITLGLGTAATAAIEDFAAASHTHAPSELTSGGASPSQILQWNGAAWVPVTFATIGGSTGANDNRLLRADGTGGSTLQASAIIVDDSGNISGAGTLNAAYAVSQPTYSGRLLNVLQGQGANASVVLAITGNGSFSLHVPDGTTAGGNNRGIHAADLQTAPRVVASQVASGNYSGLIATQECTASGANSLAVAAYRSSVTSLQSWVSGNECAVSGAYAYAGGVFSGAAGERSWVYGTGASAHTNRTWAFSSVGFGGQNGDGQGTLRLPACTTTNATPGTLFLNGASATQRMTLQNNSSWAGTVTVFARTNTAGAEWARWDYRVTIDRGANAAATTLREAVLVASSGSNAGAPPAAWSVAITADTTNGALNIAGTGEAGKTIRWLAKVDVLELMFS